MPGVSEDMFGSPGCRSFHLTPVGDPRVRMWGDDDDDDDNEDEMNDSE